MIEYILIKVDLVKEMDGDPANTIKPQEIDNNQENKTNIESN